MPSPSKKKTRTKAELNEELHNVVAKTKSAETKSPKDIAADASRSSAIRQSVEGVSLDSSVRKVTDLGLNIQQNLANIAAQITNQVNELETIKAAVALEKEELERLHGLEILAASLHGLTQEYDEASDQTARAKDTMETELEERRLATEKEIERTKAEWLYKWGIEKRDLQAAFDDQLRNTRSEERQRKENLEKTWAQREEELKKQETELVTLRRTVADAPLVTKAEVEKQVAIVGNSLKKDYEHRISLLGKDNETQKAMSEAATKTLNDQVSRLTSQLVQTQERLSAQETRVQSIAEKALDSASGARALAEVQSMTTRENGTQSRSKA